MTKTEALWTNGVHKLVKVGYDTNGNWSYWMKAPNRKRALKIQHMAMGDVSCVKLTKEILAENKPAEQINKTMHQIIEHYRKATGMPSN
jgi:hypothetical protein